MVWVIGGCLSEEQVVQQLRRLVSADFRWILVRLEDNVYKMEFFRKADLARLMVFSICKIPDSTCFLEFDRWLNREKEGMLL